MLSALKRFNQGRTYTQRKDNGILAAAHITGGGLPGNLSRVLPENIDAVVETTAWPRTGLFKFFQEYGKVSAEELFEVFNMGIGLVLVVDESSVESLIAHLKQFGHHSWRIGQTAKGKGKVQLLH